MKKKGNEPKRRGARLTAWAFLLVLFTLMIANILYKPPEISRSERRYLATFPALFVTEGGVSVLNPDFADEFESWAMDSFVAREAFRGMKAKSVFHLFRQTDNNGVYLLNGHLGKVEMLDARSVTRAGEKMAAVMDLLPEEANVWYSVIPDKGYYLSRDTGGYLPGIDYEKVLGLLAESLGREGYLDLLPVLDADAYYRTDLHWAQEKLGGVVALFGETMGFADRVDHAYVQYVLEPFRGVYTGQSALRTQGEALIYLTGKAIDSAVVRLMDTKTMELYESVVYDTERFDGLDPYDLFLSGAQPIVILENPDGLAGKELILFRDSFGSSLAPLLLSAYEKITLIDLRYVDSRLLETTVSFGEAPDVLFLYSMQILNQSDTMLVSLSS